MFELSKQLTLTKEQHEEIVQKRKKEAENIMLNEYNATYKPQLSLDLYFKLNPDKKSKLLTDREEKPKFQWFIENY